MDGVAGPTEPENGFVRRRRALLAAGSRAVGRPDRTDPVTGTPLSTLHSDYRALLPDVPVARCPRTLRTVHWPIDTAGLDGWFWDHDNPIRRAPDGLPTDWLCMTGAIAVSQPVAAASFLRRPGPRVPYVLPRLLRRDGVRAVLRGMTIGGDPAWAISYFGPRPDDVPLADLWGARHHPVVAHGAWHGRARAPFWSPDNDYRVVDWIARGRVRWIHPDDPRLRLRTDPDGYPWPRLTGNRENAIITGTTLRYPPAPPVGAISG